VLRIAVDAMGGDRAPDEIVKGAALASLQRDDLEIVLCGDTAAIGKVLSETRHDAERLHIHHASQVIRNDDRAPEALAARPDASITVAARLVAQGEADALVSAGNTGAAVLLCQRLWKTLPGVGQPALSAVYPTEIRRGAKDDPFALILDVGAGADASPEDLIVYGLMGATWATRISKNPRPRVALLSSGADTGRGARVVAAAHDLFLSHTGLNFIGAIEATDIQRGIADVVVCAGHVGNLFMKMVDAIPETMLGLARFASKERLLWRAVLAILQSGVTRLKQLTDWQEYGGAPLLGHDHLCMKAHRRSGARAIANAIKVLGVAAPTGMLREMESRVAEFQTKRTTLAS